MSEQSEIRSERYKETKLNLERMKSDDVIKRLRNESKTLRHKTIELESAFNPAIDILEDTIENQNEEIQELKEKFMKSSNGNEILIKILTKHQKMADALRQYNDKKAKVYLNMKMVQKSHEPIKIYENPDFENLQSGKDIRDAVLKLRTLSTSHPKSQKVDEMLKKLHEIDLFKVQLHKEIDFLTIPRVENPDFINLLHQISKSVISLIKI